MEMYCRCGHPIRVTVRRSDSDLRFMLQDGKLDSTNAPIDTCPDCGRPVALESLRASPPLVGEWPPLPLESTEHTIDQTV